jgi:hypothetical protein
MDFTDTTEPVAALTGAFKAIAKWRRWHKAFLGCFASTITVAEVQLSKRSSPGNLQSYPCTGPFSSRTGDVAALTANAIQYISKHYPSLT